jgi:hypothetical protein
VATTGDDNAELKWKAGVGRTAALNKYGIQLRLLLSGTSFPELNGELKRIAARIVSGVPILGVVTPTNDSL